VLYTLGSRTAAVMPVLQPAALLQIDALATAQHSAASVSRSEADAGIRKLKSHLFMQAMIAAFLKGSGCNLRRNFGRVVRDL